MTAPAEIFELRGLADTLLIGPRAAFGRGARLALGSEDAVRLRLVRALSDGGAVDRLRRFWARWGLAGDRFFDASDRVLADRVAAALRNGRLAAYVIPNSPLTYVLNPDLDRAEREVAAVKPELAAARPTMAARNVRPPPTRAGAGGGRRATFGTAIDQPIVPGGRAEGGEPTTASALRIDALSLEQRLSEVLDRTRPRLPPELRAGFARAMSPLAFTTTVAVLAAWGARPLVNTPYVMDGVRLGLAPQPSGLDLAETTEEIRELLAIAREATVEADLDRAAALLARAIARMGVLAFIRAMQHAALRIASHWRAAGGKFDKVGEAAKPVERTVERPLASLPATGTTIEKRQTTGAATTNPAKGGPQTGAGTFAGSAAEAYEAIRASTDDVAKIAKNTGIKPENIQKVKDHLFYQEHLLDRYADLGEPGHMARFDSDAAIAAAWNRLTDGTHTPADIQLLRHEAAEAWYMKRHGPSYSAAHEAAQKRYPAPDLGE